LDRHRDRRVRSGRAHRGRSTPRFNFGDPNDPSDLMNKLQRWAPFDGDVQRRIEELERRIQ
jgi:hypothetical protein